MKILILGFSKIKYMPYLSFYLNAIDLSKNDVTVFYWNRDGKVDLKLPNMVNGIEFKKKLNDSDKKIKKIPAFIEYRKKALDVIRRGNYDFIITLHTLPAILLSSTLCKQYKNRFIFDYRDYTYEKISAYKSLVGKVARSARCCFVSSNAFRVYLPKINSIYTSHNITLDSIKNRPQMHEFSLSPIRIRYWGLIRYVATNLKIIDQIKNDPRFEFHFHGRSEAEAEEIKEYCKKHKIQNVFFHGEYKPEERIQFALETDLIQNSQDFDEITKNAVSNKFYDGAIFYVPQLCTKKSYMGHCLRKYGIGLPFDYDSPHIADDIYSYLSSLDKATFQRKCDAFLDTTLKEYYEGINVLKKIFG